MATTFTPSTGLLQADSALFPTTFRGPAGHLEKGKGLLGYTPVVPSTTVKRGAVDVPMELAMHEGANKYENYVRAWPDLLHHYLNRIPEDTRSMAEWGKAHWETLIRARAIENSVFISATNMCGMHHSGRKTYGHSIFCDPWGKIVNKCSSKPKILNTIISLDKVEEVRKKIPSIFNS